MILIGNNGQIKRDISDGGWRGSVKNPIWLKRPQSQLGSEHFLTQQIALHRRPGELNEDIGSTEVKSHGLVSQLGHDEL